MKEIFDLFWCQFYTTGRKQNGGGKFWREIKILMSIMKRTNTRQTN